MSVISADEPMIRGNCIILLALYDLAYAGRISRSALPTLQLDNACLSIGSNIQRKLRCPKCAQHIRWSWYVLDVEAIAAEPAWAGE